MQPDCRAPLLVELLTEELPPRALQRLGAAFADGLLQALQARGLAEPDARVERFATPRRLAVRIDDVAARAADRPVEHKGPSVRVALDADGQPTQALLKWAQKLGASLDALERASDGRQDVFRYRSIAPGQTLEAGLDAALGETIAALPIPKTMHYQLADGRTTVAFVRPAHGLLVLHGVRVVAVSALGLDAGRSTRGHRFQGEGEIVIDHARDYEARLNDAGRVIASFDARRARIETRLRAQAAALGAALGDETALQALLDEVTALVEWPAVLVGGFEPAFLQVPQECLILTMRTNQKYFPLFETTAGADPGHDDSCRDDSCGQPPHDGQTATVPATRGQARLLPKFLIVSNMEVADPGPIIAGNERVVRPRLADARFFYDQDRRRTLESRVPELDSVVYHARLGSQAERTQRVRRIAGAIAALLGIDSAHAERAALLARTDLLTGMVGEFPELQGVMGSYYARHDGEDPAVATAIAEQYLPRFAGDALPASMTGIVLALADKMETLTGLFGIGQQPTGDKDPFALRRHALGVLRILMEKTLPLPLDALVEAACDVFGASVECPREALTGFFFERLSGWLREHGHAVQEVSAVVALRPMRLDTIAARLDAVRSFSRLPEAQALAAANKRIANILKKAPQAGLTPVDAALFTEAAERELSARMQELAPAADARMQAGDWSGALCVMAGARAAVDRFFDEVMVMAEDERLRNNRLALLARLREAMNRVADISILG